MNHFPHYRNRTVFSLDGLWDAASLGEHPEPESFSPGNIQWDGPAAIPGVVDALPDYRKQRGLFAFRKRVSSTTAGKPAVLKFGGLGLWAKLFVDGQALATCRTPYAPWEVEVPASEKSEREIILLIDNRFDAQRVPLFDPYFDFYGYGGVYRSVEWHEVEKLSLERAVVSTVDLKGKVQVEFRFRGKITEELELRIFFDDDQQSTTHRISPDNAGKPLKLTVPSPRPWHPEHPHLHQLKVHCQGEILIERFGLRKIETKNGKIILNDQPIKLLGYNRHEAHPQFGPALPLSQLVQDLQILRQTGCNFIRGSHYPQDQRFLDLCDEMGFLVWEEALGWQAHPEHFANPDFCDLQETQTRAMVRTSINHPSIIMWGFLNECDSHLPESEDFIGRLAKAAKEEDSSRLVTFASNHPFEERNYRHMDVLAINAYPGWYPEGEHKERPLEEIEERIDRLLAHFKKEGVAHKPFLLSEIGAGAIYGWRDELEAHWSEQYQASYLDLVTKRVLRDPSICGVALWQFCDGRTYADTRALGRPRAFNNKGSFDEYRRPKLAAAVVRQNFRSGSAKV
ncbi:MAG: beta-galactosidase [Opitutales bacterium]|nr:beta-galactosidase [Opitutales bacterium]MCH8539297.1 beta-galactosidase [Opitutales bacterium]